MEQPAATGSEATTGSDGRAPVPGAGVGARLAGIALRLTTRRCPGRRIPPRAVPLFARAFEAGWTIRLAGARWDALWSGEAGLQRRLRCLVLPDPAIGLDDAQWSALAARRLRDLGLGGEVPDRLLPHLAGARSALWLARQRQG